jgi:hypothetical protein
VVRFHSLAPLLKGYKESGFSRIFAANMAIPFISVGISLLALRLDNQENSQKRRSAQSLGASRKNTSR